MQVSFAKIGIFDAAVELLRSGAVTKPLLKGSYNLARAIASSMSTAANMTLGVVPAEVAPLEQDMLEWFQFPVRHGLAKTHLPVMSPVLLKGSTSICMGRNIE